LSVTNIGLGQNAIGDKGALLIADALKLNTLVTNIDLICNGIGAEGASPLADALKVNTSVTDMDSNYNGLASTLNCAPVNELLARNVRLRHIFLFDARQMLLSVMCADECGVVWPYLLGVSCNTDGTVAPTDTLRVEFASVVEERRRRR
jgi:hypothetical protein